MTVGKGHENSQKTRLDRGEQTDNSRGQTKPDYTMFSSVNVRFGFSIKTHMSFQGPYPHSSQQLSQL